MVHVQPADNSWTNPSSFAHPRKVDGTACLTRSQEHHLHRFSCLFSRQTNGIRSADDSWTNPSSFAHPRKVDGTACLTRSQEHHLLHHVSCLFSRQTLWCMCDLQIIVEPIHLASLIQGRSMVQLAWREVKSITYSALVVCSPGKHFGVRPADDS